MSAPPLVILERQDGIARLRINRADQLNALDLPTAQELLVHCKQLRHDHSVRAIILQGEGRAFGAGGDVSAMHTNAQAVLPPLIDAVHECIELLAQSNAPVIARLHGVVAGGGLSLAMACDLTVAAENTRLSFAYTRIGASCDAGSSWTLPRLVGLNRALEIALLNPVMSAAEALQMGLLNRVVAASELDATVTAMAQQLAAGPTLAYGRIKHLMRVSSQNSLHEQLALERAHFLANSLSKDFKHGVDAFVRKTPPQFQGD